VKGEAGRLQERARVTTAAAATTTTTILLRYAGLLKQRPSACVRVCLCIVLLLLLLYIHNIDSGIRRWRE